MKTVHLIGHAHLDPAWLWPVPEGIDAAVATVRGACDLLDNYPSFVFTASGSWFHQQAELIDPALFARVRRFVDAGRWALVGGMVIEPDCNLASAETFCRQLEVGQAYFRSRFGRATTVGYNIDSFGHTAYLPRYLRQGGLDSYLFMRPGVNEMDLSGPFFRWQSPDGFEVLAFRLPLVYCTADTDLRGRIENTLAVMQDGIDNIMLFYGVGDHGGGPTRQQIDWLTEHADTFPGVRLVFSHPRACLDAVAPYWNDLPIVRGELQHHAVGCYTVERRIKVGTRRAESRLVQAERTIRLMGCKPGPLADAWQAVLFNQFHDIAGGTCVDAASRRAAAELAAAESTADLAIVLATRAAMRSEAQPGVHKVVVLNTSDRPFDGVIEHEPWLDGQLVRNAILRDEAGEVIETQAVLPACKLDSAGRMLFRLSIPPGSRRVLRIEPMAPKPSPAGALGIEHLGADLGGEGLTVADWSLGLDVHDDPTDTWSHSVIDRFPDRLLGSFRWAGQWESFEAGPMRASVRRLATWDHSRLWCQLSRAVGEPLLRMRLLLTWSQTRQLLRLTICPVRGPIIRRTDRVSGGWIDRPISEREFPFAGGTIVATATDSLAVVAPEIFSLKVDASAIGLLLVRSPFHAHHDPTPAAWRPDYPVTDQGQHELEMRLWPNAPLDVEPADRVIEQMLQPPIVFDLTG